MMIKDTLLTACLMEIVEIMVDSDVGKACLRRNTSSTSRSPRSPRAPEPSSIDAADSTTLLAPVHQVLFYELNNGSLPRAALRCISACVLQIPGLLSVKRENYWAPKVLDMLQSGDESDRYAALHAVLATWTSPLAILAGRGGLAIARDKRSSTSAAFFDAVQRTKFAVEEASRPVHASAHPIFSAVNTAVDRDEGALIAVAIWLETCTEVAAGTGVCPGVSRVCLTHFAVLSRMCTFRKPMYRCQMNAKRVVLSAGINIFVENVAAKTMLCGIVYHLGQNRLAKALNQPWKSARGGAWRFLAALADTAATPQLWPPASNENVAQKALRVVLADTNSNLLLQEGVDCVKATEKLVGQHEDVLRSVYEAETVDTICRVRRPGRTGAAALGNPWRSSPPSLAAAVPVASTPIYKSCRAAVSCILFPSSYKASDSRTKSTTRAQMNNLLSKVHLALVSNLLSKTAAWLQSSTLRKIVVAFFLSSVPIHSAFLVSGENSSHRAYHFLNGVHVATFTATYTISCPFSSATFATATDHQNTSSHLATHCPSLKKPRTRGSLTNNLGTYFFWESGSGNLERIVL